MIKLTKYCYIPCRLFQELTNYDFKKRKLLIFIHSTAEYSGF